MPVVFKKDRQVLAVDIFHWTCDMSKNRVMGRGKIRKKNRGSNKLLRRRITPFSCSQPWVHHFPWLPSSSVHFPWHACKAQLSVLPTLFKVNTVTIAWVKPVIKLFCLLWIIGNKSKNKFYPLFPQCIHSLYN